MNSSTLKVRFYFPRITAALKTKSELAHLIFKNLKKDRGINYAGYLNDNALYHDLLLKIGKGDLQNYHSLGARQKRLIADIITKTFSKCQKKLSYPLKLAYIFVFPWFPNAQDNAAFGGVNAVTPYMRTMHFFLDSDNFKTNSLMETVAHEFNHLVFYYYHRGKKYTLVEQMAIEGLAENFREDVLGGKRAPWSGALTKSEAGKIFRSLKPLLRSRSSRVYSKVFWGSERYKRWTGYSIGYWLVKEFIKKKPSISWQALMRMKVENVLGCI